MPGYLVHSATCKSEIQECLCFMRGVEAPDLLKKHFRMYGYEGAREKYETIKCIGMPDYVRLEDRIQQKESLKSSDGLHYGMSSQPDVWKCWNNLSREEKKSPFFRGYEWHLLTDFSVYRRLDIETKFREFLEQYEGATNFKELEKKEVKHLHMDWNRTNAKIRALYPDIGLLPEIAELGVVQYIEDGKELRYVDWEILKSAIEFLRTLDPLQGNMEEIIETVINWQK